MRRRRHQEDADHDVGVVDGDADDRVAGRAEWISVGSVHAGAVQPGGSGRSQTNARVPAWPMIDPALLIAPPVATADGRSAGSG